MTMGPHCASPRFWRAGSRLLFRPEATTRPSLLSVVVESPHAPSDPQILDAPGISYEFLSHKSPASGALQHSTGRVNAPTVRTRGTAAPVNWPDGARTGCWLRSRGSRALDVQAHMCYSPPMTPTTPPTGSFPLPPPPWAPPVATSLRDRRGSAASPLQRCWKSVARIRASSYEIPQNATVSHTFSGNPGPAGVKRASGAASAA